MSVLKSVSHVLLFICEKTFSTLLNILVLLVLQRQFFTSYLSRQA